MGLLENVLDFFGRKSAGESVKAPDGVCPNCWGSQEYAGQIREIEKDFQVDVNAGSAKHAFIKDFVVNHVDGIKLRNKLDGLECEKCHAVYPNSSAKG